MKIETRLTNNFIDLEVDKVSNTVFENDSEIEDLIINYTSVIDDLLKYTSKSLEEIIPNDSQTNLGATFDYEALREAFEATKSERGTINNTKGLKAIAKDSGLSYGTISRFSKGEIINTISILKICKWIDQPITNFIT